MKQEKEPLFPLRKPSHYILFCLCMLALLAAAFLGAVRLGRDGLFRNFSYPGKPHNRPVCVSALLARVH